MCEPRSGLRFHFVTRPVHSTHNGKYRRDIGGFLRVWFWNLDPIRLDPIRAEHPFATPLYGARGGKAGREGQGEKERVRSSDREGGGVRQTASVLVMSDHTGSLARCLE